MQARGGDGKAGTHAEGLGPVEFASLGVNGVERARMPDDELPLAARLENHRRAIAEIRPGQRAPQHFAGHFVKRNGGAFFAAGEANEFVAIHQWMRGESPHGRLCAEVLFEIDLPKHLAVLRAEAKKISHRAQRVNAVAINGRRAARTGGIANRVRAIVFVFPQEFAVGFIEAQHTLGAR